MIPSDDLPIAVLSPEVLAARLAEIRALQAARAAAIIAASDVVTRRAERVARQGRLLRERSDRLLRADSADRIP